MVARPAGSNLTIDGERLWSSLMRLAEIGATPKGGVCRLALTEVDKAARDLFVEWCREAGCSIQIDELGNIFARREGKHPNALPIVTGSHIDSQPTGGKFDGAYGVLAGLEVVRTLNDAGFETDAPIEIVVWTNEEGSRFAPAMMASGAFAGAFDADWVRSREDPDGITFAAALDAIGYAGTSAVGDHAIGAYIETHIEQGPILEAEEKTVGVVTGAQGQRWYEITVTGQEAHAGPTPMARRRDALVGSSRIIDAVNRIGFDFQPSACATVGMIECRPNSRNTIPGEVMFTVDFRHPVEDRLGQMDEVLRTTSADISAELGLDLVVEEIWHFPAAPFADVCVDAVRASAMHSGFEHMDIVSGAGHDACYVARVAPTGMIFVPCADGISHNEIESAEPDDVAAGCQVLVEAMVRLANESGSTNQE